MNWFEDKFKGVRGKEIRFITTISSEISASGSITQTNIIKESLGLDLKYC